MINKTKNEGNYILNEGNNTFQYIGVTIDAYGINFSCILEFPNN